MEELRARAGTEIGGRFLLRERLGSGTYGTVWRAADRELGRDVALKLLNAERRGHAISVERFKREAEILTALEHPNVVRAFAWSIGAEGAWLAMELMAGAPMSALLGARAASELPLPAAEVVHIVGAVADAVAYAHEQGVVHRDLKPRNIMVGPLPDSRVTVLDFGVAKLVDTPAGDATTVGRLLGSLLFMSPEQLGAGIVDSRTDVFALATIAFELLTLRRPWAVDERGELLRALDAPVARDRMNNHATILARISGGERPSVRRWLPDAAAELDGVLAAAWAPDPRARTPDPRALAAGIAKALGVAPYVAARDGLGATVPLSLARPPPPPADSAPPPPAELTPGSLSSTEGPRPPSTVARLMEGVVVVVPERAARTAAVAGLMLLAMGAGWLTARLTMTGDAPPRVPGSAVAAPTPSVAATTPGVVATTPSVAATTPGSAATTTSVARAGEPTPAVTPERREDGAQVEAPRRAAPAPGARSRAAPAPSVAAGDKPGTARPSGSLMSEVHRRVGAARGGDDPRAVAEAAAAIARAAGTIGDDQRRLRVMRYAEGAAATGQVEHLEAALSALEDALR